MAELPGLQVQLGDLAERRALKAALAKVDAAHRAEEARIKAAQAPKVCFTMSCKDYAMDLGAERKLWEDSLADGPASKMGFMQ